MPTDPGHLPRLLPDRSSPVARPSAPITRSGSFALGATDPAVSVAQVPIVRRRAQPIARRNLGAGAGELQPATTGPSIRLTARQPPKRFVDATNFRVRATKRIPYARHRIRHVKSPIATVICQTTAENTQESPRTIAPATHLPSCRNNRSAAGIEPEGGVAGPATPPTRTSRTELPTPPLRL